MNYFSKYTGMAVNMAFRLLKIKNRKLPGLPAHIQVEITNKCNLRCLSCHRDLLYPETTSMSFENFKKVYDEIHPARINISGLGEPFLNPDIFKIIEHAKKCGSAVNCATNFTLVGNKIDRLIESGIDQIKISIDASKKETFLKIRKKDLYETLIENIAELNRVKKERGVNRPDIRFNYALQKENIDELPDIIELAGSMNVRAIYIQYLIYIDREDRKDSLVGDMTAEKLMNVLHKADKTAQKNGIITNIDMWKRDFNLFWNNMQPSDLRIKNHRPCYFPWFSSWIDADGTVRPCPIIPWKKGTACMGNAFHESFLSIWNNSRYQDFRNSLVNGVRPNEVCEQCIPPSLETIFQIGTKLLPK